MSDIDRAQRQALVAQHGQCFAAPETCPDPPAHCGCGNVGEHVPNVDCDRPEDPVLDAAMVERAMQGGYVAELPAETIAERLRAELGLAAPQDPEQLVTAVCDLLWAHGVYLADATPVARAIVALLTVPVSPLQLDEGR